MPRYVVLANWTDQAIKNVKHTTERMDHGGEIAEKHGSKLEQAYWTVGPYDMLTLFEAPEEVGPERLPPPDRLFGQRQDHHAAGLRRGRDVGDTPEARLRLSTSRYGSSSKYPKEIAGGAPQVTLDGHCELGAP